MKEKILIVDDDSQILKLMAFFLGGGGYEVLVASDGLEAMEKLTREKPDLVLLDIMLPEIPGFSICQSIRSDPALKNTKVIMLSAKLFPQDHSLARMAGADGFVTKPFDIAEVLDIVDHALHPRQGEKSEFLIGGCWGKPFHKTAFA